MSTIGQNQTQKRSADSAFANAETVVLDIVHQGFLINGGLASLIIILFALLLRYLLIRFVKGKSEILRVEQRKWMQRINSGTLVLVMLALIFVWAPALRTFALSLSAVAVAMVIALKEVIMCFTGSLFRSGNRTFTVGDWITVEGVTGEVLHISAVDTVIQEIELANRFHTYSGRTITIPNSKFLSANVENANFTKDYTYFDFTLTPPSTTLSTEELLTTLYDVVTMHFAPYREGAMHFNKKIERETSLDFDDPEPHIYLKTDDSGRRVFTVRLFIPAQTVASMRSFITRDFLKYIESHEQSESTQNNKDTRDDSHKAA